MTKDADARDFNSAPNAGQPNTSGLTGSPRRVAVPPDLAGALKTAARHRIKLDDQFLLKFGNDYQFVAVLYAGQGRTFLAVLPGEEDDPEGQLLDDVEVLDLDLPAWQRLLEQTDQMKTEVEARLGDGTILKAFIRKSTRQVEQGVSWTVFRRDRYACRYCGKDNLPLTVDHLVCWEVGGPSTEQNMVAACRKCNKTRGQLPYALWLAHPYYEQVSKALTQAQRDANLAVAGTLDKIPRLNYVRQHR